MSRWVGGTCQCDSGGGGGGGGVVNTIHPRFNVSLIFGAGAAAEEGVPGESALPASSSIASTGGLVANGDGTPAANPNDGRLLPAFEGPRLNPRFAKPGAVGGGGLVAEAEGVRGGGTVPLLNSAQRGHLRLVSKQIKGY